MHNSLRGEPRTREQGSAFGDQELQIVRCLGEPAPTQPQIRHNLVIRDLSIKQGPERTGLAVRGADDMQYMNQPLAVGYGMVWHGMAWHGMAWHGMAWHGMGWDGMGWYGMVWYGMVWYGMVCMYIGL